MPLRRPVIAVAVLMVRPVERREGDLLHSEKRFKLRLMILQPDQEFRAFRFHELAHHADQPLGRVGYRHLRVHHQHVGGHGDPRDP